MNFKNKSKNILLRNRFNTFLDNHRNISDAIDRVFKFIQKYQISVHKSLEDYQIHQIKQRRLFLVTLLRAITLLTCIRYSISALIRTKWMFALMSDANYLMGNQMLTSLVLSIACFTIFCIGSIVQFKEMSKTNELFQFMYDFKHKRIIPLNDKHSKRLTLIVNLMARYLMEQAFWPLVLATWGIIGMTTVIEYINEQFYLISILIWNLLFLGSLIQFYGIVWIGLVVSVLITLYLKYKFREINDLIEFSLKVDNKSLLWRAIAEHNYICVKTSQLNDFFSHMVFQLYYIASPALILLLYLSHAKDGQLFGKLLAAVVFSLVFSVVISANLLYAQISGSSRRPRNTIYRHMIHKQLSPKERLKLSAFIEKLDGPDIGIYCWNLFPMNNYEFYLYVANCTSTYFLILGFI